MQDNVTSTVTTVLTAFTSFGLAAVSAWFASERWAFSRHRGQKWLIDVLHESMEEFIRLPGINWIYKSSKYLTRNTVKLWRRCKQTASTLLDVSRSCLHRRSDEEESEGADDIEAMRYSTNSKSATIAPPFSPELKSERVSADTIVMPIAEEPLQLPATPVNSPASPGFSESSGMPTSPLAAAELMSPPPSIAAPAPPSQGKKLWKNAIRTVKIHQQQAAATSMGANESSNSESAPPPSGRFPLRRRTTSSGMTGATSGLPFNEKKKTLTLPEPIAMAKSRITSLIPKLAMLEPTQDLPAHNALVRHLQFSPDGKYLATSSWDRTSVIFRVGDPFVQHRVLAHTQGFVGQVAWSPAGNILLTKLPRGIKIWAADTSRTDSVTTRICTRPIDRGVPVETLTWMPDGESFLSVEETSTVSKINLQGKVLEQYDFGPVRLHDVAVTPDSLRLVGVGPLIESPTGLKPSKSRQEKRLVVYNLETKQIESRIPLLNEVRDITIGTNVRGDWIALVSYENKAPPQLWKIELVRDRENSNTIARLTLRHTYMPKTPVDFAGPSYFGGKNNELVLCPGKAGDIHIWDQESGALVHFIRGQAHGGDMTCLAWNHAHDDSFMFATGSHDGGVRIWTRLEPEVQEVPFLERRPSYPMASRFPFMIPRTESPEPDNASTHSAHPTTPQPPPPRHRARAISFSSSGSSKL